MARVRLLVGPAASGKTARCIEWLRHRAAGQPLGSHWVVVPDRIQTQFFRQRLAQAGGILGVHVGTFDDLYAEILGRGGDFRAVAPEVVVRRVMRLAVRDAWAGGQLRHFGSIAERPGFLAIVEEHIAELQRETVSPEDLIAACGKSDAAAIELSHVYRAYLCRLDQLGVTDLAGRYGSVLQLLDTDGRELAWLRGLVVDGFDNFEGHQLRSLGALVRCVDEIVITLPGEAGGDGAAGNAVRRTAHLRFARALGRLCETTSAGIETTASTFWVSPALGQLEAQLLVSPPALASADSGAAPPSGPDAGEGCRTDHDIEFIEVRSPADEAREALRWLKARCLRDGIALDECAIITPDPEHYRPLIRAAAQEFGIPVRFTIGEPLLDAPRIVALLELLRLPLDDYPRRALIDSIRTPFLDLSCFGLARQDAEVLEVVSRRALVLGGWEEWSAALASLAEQAPVLSGDGDEHGPAALLPAGERASALADGLEALAQTLMPQARPLAEWVHWLEDLMVKLGYAPLDADEEAGDDNLGPAVDDLTAYEQAAHNELQEVLRSLVLTDRLLGEPPITYASFVAELQALIATTAFHLKLDRGTPAVQVLRLLEARGPRFGAVAVLGLSEGLLPQLEREDPFLPDPLRGRLGLEPRLGREQRGLFYLAITRADRHLLLSRPYLDDAGEEWQPSPFWGAALAAIGAKGASVQRLVTGGPRPLSDAASPGELLFWASRQAAPPPAEAGVQERWRRVAEGAAVLAARIGRRGGGRYEGSLADLRPHLSERFGSHYVWSASRLETYGVCPLRFYVEVALGLAPLEPPAPGLDAAQLGTIYHQVLERAYRSAADPTDLEAVLAAIRQVAPTVFAEAPAKLGFRPTAWWEAEQTLLLEDLENTARGLHASDGEWRPVALETRFGMEEPPLRLDVAGEAIQLRGIIDRVDGNAAGQIRVIDYKAGFSHLGPSDLVSGRRLQLPLYAMAAQQVLGLGEAADGFYWAIRQARRGALQLARFQHVAADGTYRGAAGAAALAVKHVGRFVRHIREGSFEPRPPADGCPSYCAAASWCWRYVAARSR